MKCLMIINLIIAFAFVIFFFLRVPANFEAGLWALIAFVNQAALFKKEFN